MSEIVRGTQSISQDELTAHLAMGLRLENVAVLVGSGASVAAGGQTIGNIWQNLQQQHPHDLDALREAGFLTDAVAPNIENVISSLDVAISDAKRRAEATGQLDAWRVLLRRAVVGAARLDDRLWEDRSTPETHQLLSHYVRLLAKLQASRQPGQSAPWVFSTNYDLAVEWAAERIGLHLVNGFIGLHDRRFQPNAFDLNLKNAFASGEARFGSYNLNLVKLHGSLNWNHKEGGDVREVPCETIRDDLLKFANGETEELSSLMIHPSAAKYFDTIGFVYGELIRRFTDFLSRPNSLLLVCGYGFNDNHINRVIASGLLNPTLQMVIYYPDYHQFIGMPNRFLSEILQLGLPRVIVKGDGAAAHFVEFVADLPDPAIVDELSPDVRRILTSLARQGAAVPAAGGERGQ